MQSITIGTPQAYLRLTAVRWPSEGARPEVPREKRRFLEAELHLKEVTATRKLDLMRDYGGLTTFFEEVAARWQQWENSQMVWGRRRELELEFLPVRGHSGEADCLILSIALRNHGWHVQAWSVETSIVVGVEDLQTIARDLRTLTD